MRASELPEETVLPGEPLPVVMARPGAVGVAYMELVGYGSPAVKATLGKATVARRK